MLFLATPILLMYLRNHRIHQNPPPHNTRHAGFNELYLNLPRTGSVYATEPIRLFTDG